MPFSTRLLRPALLLLAGLLAALGVCVGEAEAHVGTDTTDVVTYREAPLGAVLADVEARTGVRFLYRDALVAGVTVTMEAAPGRLLKVLDTELAAHGLALSVDRARRQAILTRRATRVPTVLSGQVVDAETGIRLPLATLTWRLEGRVRGTAADASGRFQIPLTGGNRAARLVRVSYVGYEPATVRIDRAAPPAELTVRLAPIATEAPGVVVHSRTLESTLDTTWQPLIRPETTVPLGEASVLRALEPLPSVGLSPALVNGLTVRGSRADAFQVLLDGMTIYNQTHLFGLFDAFNAEALHTVGFFYGVAPAEYAAPPGGTMAFQTRTGSQSAPAATAEISPIAVSATAEGPVDGGQGSWLVSARHSILGVDAFGNDALIAQGLGVDRRTEPIPGSGRTLNDLLLQPGVPSARFYDLHARGLWETPSGGRWSLSLYAGRDRAEQGGTRLERDDAPRFRERLRRDRLDTTATAVTHRWGNVGASLQWQKPVTPRLYSDLTLAASRYDTRYNTDTFSYAVSSDNSNGFRAFYGPFEQANTLRDLTLRHRLHAMDGTGGTWTGGYALSAIDVSYDETSVVQETFSGTQSHLQAALFGETERTWGPVALRAGARMQYVSTGDLLRVSPRVQVHVGNGPVTANGGYSRNYQFLHRLHLIGDVSSPVWIPMVDGQAPGEVNHWMAGIALHPTASTAVQIDGYWKTHDNLRLHRSLRLQESGQTVLFTPWTTRNTSVARGLETMVQQRWGRTRWTGAWTWARVDVDPVGPRGAEPADWDRRHQGMLRGDVEVSDGITLGATGVLGTGTPNPYAALPGEADRLGTYARVDVSGAITRTAGATTWTVRGSVFNLTDRDNPWHRTPVSVLLRDGRDPNPQPDLRTALVDVYDLGLRPTCSLTLRW